jgi:bifunctional DNA-binding transcriptional regulator/antitoxin component of YhaV-PrlF toxin-antitoxin module
MAAMTFASKLKDDGTFTVPQEAVKTLGLHPGDEITIRIETTDAAYTGEPNQVELQRRAARCFAEADSLVREPGKSLSDPLEAAWAAGVEEKARRMGIKL